MFLERTGLGPRSPLDDLWVFAVCSLKTIHREIFKHFVNLEKSHLNQGKSYINQYKSLEHLQTTMYTAWISKINIIL